MNACIKYRVPKYVLFVAGGIALPSQAIRTSESDNQVPTLITEALESHHIKPGLIMFGWPLFRNPKWKFWR